MHTACAPRRITLPGILTCAFMLMTVGGGAAVSQSSTPSLEEAYSTLIWRSIGPDRGGRSIAVAGSAARPQDAYFGATGGGLWKSEDYGSTWRPITDGQIASSSVGAVAVAPSNPDIIYLGMGEGQLRANVMQGDGLYKSTDGGTSWQHMGLRDTRTITKIRIHPRDPDILYVSALGDPYMPTAERGVYKSEDGGESFRKVLFRSEEAGAIDLVMDPSNPDRLIATLWHVYRKPWKLWSGGPESGIFLTEDGGKNWEDITRRPGLPAGVLGKMTVSISAANPNRIYANIEAEAGGLYRSDDGGATWAYINGNKKLWQRSFYFMQVRADPVEPDRVYVLSFKLERSEDGGKSFEPVPTRHADSHDLWIDPTDSSRMIVADDGGGSVTVNGGQTWTAQDYPTAQIYRVTTTQDEPYHVCGAQQDNTTICVASRTRSDVGYPVRDRYSDPYTIAFSEMGSVAAHPQKPGVFFVGATNALTRYDRETERTMDVSPYPYVVMGEPALAMPERWNWTYPIVFDRRTPGRLYAGSQHVWQSDDEGQTWAKISPDLTRADPQTLGETGGPIQLDQDGPEVYGTLYSLAPSRLTARVLWAGSDDGLIHLTRDGGEVWADVTPPGLEPNSRISFIEASYHQPGHAYAAVKRSEMGDRQPYIYRTNDFGSTWQRIDRTLPAEAFVHTVREDPVVPDLLYAGTEHGVFVSLDRGDVWRPLAQNMPDVHISGLQVRGNELVAATHGRSFYILEGLTLLRSLAVSGDLTQPRLFEPAGAVRRSTPAIVHIWLPVPLSSASLNVRDAGGKKIRTLFSDRPLDAGPHAFTWDLAHEGATVFEGMILESPSPAHGPMAVPGAYTVTLSGDGLARPLTSEVTLALDPRFKGEVTEADLVAQRDLALRARNAVDRANRTVIEIRGYRARLLAALEAGERPESDRLNRFLKSIAATEKALYQVKNQSPKDKIANPIRLNDRLAGILGMLRQSDGPPTAAQREVLKQLEKQLGSILKDYNRLKAVHADLVN